MNIKKFMSFTAIIVLSLSLSSCGFARNEEKISYNRFQKIVEAIEKKDKDTLKKMFSPAALKEANDIDSGIEYVINLYKGKITEKDSARQGSDSKENGERTSELKSTYWVTTDKDKYIVFFIDKLVDTKNPDNVGLYMLQIIKESDEEKEFDWGNKIKCSGIYRPSGSK